MATGNGSLPRTLDFRDLRQPVYRHGVQEQPTYNDVGYTNVLYFWNNGSRKQTVRDTEQGGISVMCPTSKCHRRRSTDGSRLRLEILGY